jgi:hypothetical protein
VAAHHGAGSGVKLQKIEDRDQCDQANQYEGKMKVARNRCCFSVLRKTTNLPTGTIIAPPMPWMTRATTNSSRPLLNPQKMEEMVKTAIAPQTLFALQTDQQPTR